MKMRRAKTAFVRGDASGSTFVGNQSDAARFVDGPAAGAVFRHNRHGRAKRRRAKPDLPPTGELEQWILAQVAEDKGVSEAAEGGGWRRRSDYPGLVFCGDMAVAATNERVECEPDPHVRHIVRWQPQRALDECAARTEAVRLATGQFDLLKTQALPYAKRPGYADAIMRTEVAIATAMPPLLWWRRLTATLRWRSA